MDALTDYLRPILKLILGWDIRATSVGVSGGVALHGLTSLIADPSVSVLGLAISLDRVQLHHTIALGLFLAFVWSRISEKKLDKQLEDRIVFIRSLRQRGEITRARAADLYLELAHQYVRTGWAPDAPERMPPKDGSNRPSTDSDPP